MGKDPAFLFYPSDWTGGTRFLTRHEKGAYLDLLIAQFDGGHMTIDMIGHVLGQDFGQVWPKIKSKFTQDEAGAYYNERLEIEQTKRKNFISSRLNNKKGKNQYSKEGEKKGHMTSDMKGHMVNENINENIDGNNKGGVGEKSLDPINPELMGFLGRVRHWMETEHNYIWTDQDNRAASGLEAKFKELHRRKGLPTDPKTLTEQFKLMVINLPEWVKIHKFSLEYWDTKFNEIRGTKSVNGTSKRKKPEGMRESDWFFMQNLSDEEIEAYGFKMEKI